ncbi:hypothetical protein BH09VER1_BH09VER1_15770 [soil metagenome]
MACRSHLAAKLAPIVVVALALLGCATSRDLPAFQPASSQGALVRWQRGKVSMTSDAVFARSANGSVLLRLYKQSPAPLLELRLEPDSHLVAKGTLAGPGWAGPASSAPAPLLVWTILLTACQNANHLPDGENEIHTAAAHIACVKQDSHLKSLSISRTDAPESVTILFK